MDFTLAGRRMGAGDEGASAVADVLLVSLAEEGLSRASKYCSIALRTVSITSLSSMVGGKLVGKREEESGCQ